MSFNPISNFEDFCVLIRIQQDDTTLHPDKSVPQYKPFFLAPHQEEIYALMQKHREVVVQKTRQIGLSTFIRAFGLWRQLFVPNTRDVYITAGDKAVKDTIYAISQMYNSINPAFRLPLDITANKIENRTIGSVLNIYTDTPKTARGSTCDWAFIDEIDWYKDVELTLSSVLPATKKRIYFSTPQKENGYFHKLCLSHPVVLKRDIYDMANEGWFGSKYKQEWIEHTLAGKSRQLIAKEYLCQFKGIVENTIIELPEENIQSLHNTNKPFVFSMDVGWENNSVVLYAAIVNNKLHVYDEADYKRTNIYDIAKDIKKKPYKLIYGICDSSGKRPEMTTISKINSVYKVLRDELGKKIYTHKLNNKLEMVEQLQRAIYRGNLLIDPKCVKLIEVIQNYAWKDGRIPHISPYCDYLDALVYLVVNWNIINRTSMNRNIPKRIQPFMQL